MIKYIKFKQDNDGHWYIIPEEREKEFESVLQSGDNKDFNDKFWGYMCGTYPSYFSVIMKSDFEAYQKRIAELWDEADVGVDIDWDTLEYIY